MKTMKEVVEALNKVQPGLIPVSKIQDKASLFQDSSKMASFAQSEQTEDDGVRTLLELLQKVGVDRIQKLIDEKEQSIVEEDEWDQNFD